MQLIPCYLDQVKPLATSNISLFAPLPPYFPPFKSPFLKIAIRAA